MKNILFILGILLLVCQTAEAGIITNFARANNNYYYPHNTVRYRGYPPNYYNNNYYYNNHRHCPYHGHYNRYPQNFYYNQKPVIYRSRVIRKSSANNSEILVSNQFTGLDKIEKQILFQTYEYDNAKNRIERLEHKLFGAAQSGELEERFFVLKSAAKNYKTFNPDSNFAMRQNNNSYYDNGYRPPLFTGTMGSSWKANLLGNFRNQMMGTPTGFTPAMDPAYMDWFEAERAMMRSGQDVDYRSNTGYYKSNTNRGATTGVTIID